MFQNIYIFTVYLNFPFIKESWQQQQQQKNVIRIDIVMLYLNIMVFTVFYFIIIFLQPCCA